MLNTKYVIQTVVLALAGSVLVFVLVGTLLADRWQIRTTRNIAAPVAQVAERVTDLGRWSDWSALDFQLGNPTDREITGVAGSSGQLATWRGPMGVATVKLTHVDAAAVDYLIGYQYGSEQQSLGGKFTGRIEWQQAGNSTAVTWIENGELTNLVQRWSNWFGALQDKVQQVQRSSLAGLDEDIRRDNDRAAGGDASKREQSSK